MRMEASRRILSYLLIAAGSLLLFLGARDLLDWRVGQWQAQRQFTAAAAPASAKPSSLPKTGTAVVARLLIPRLDTDLYVVEGDGPEALRRGPGHLTGTAMPGARGNCVIAGHRDTHFRVLKDIHRGDEIMLATPAGRYLYRVVATKVISPDNLGPLHPTRDAELNLITCYPFSYIGDAPKRFVVMARLAGPVGMPEAFSY
jgi:sortase A